MLRWWVRRLRRDDGAAAVEFALIFPFLAVPLIFGMISGGLLFNSYLNLTGTTREVSRYAATLPGATTNLSQWLQKVHDSAVSTLGSDWNKTWDTTAPSESICVAYIPAGGDLSQGTEVTDTGSGAGSDTSGSCFSEATPETDAHVQVLMQRTSDLNMILYNFHVPLSSRSLTRYESS